jgi:DNA integrity scanning protein DisA with diadenylate cyclase activity
VLQIVGELAREGREGKPVGTLFVVGDYENVKKYSHQLIVNPFQGYIEEERNILDPSIEETVKEYAKLDGAFIISEGGTILSAGSYLSGQPKTGKLLSGLGARHAAAVGITTVTAAFSIVLSESTRKISVFHTGKRVFSL